MTENKNLTLPDKQPAIRVAAMPKDTNSGGSIFGGWIMSQVDVAGAIVALARAKGRVATVGVKSFEFHEPVFVGDLVSCYADVIRVGRTSITVRVEVYAQRNPSDPQTVKVTEAELTYVALDENRRPRKIPES
ncbi:MAG: acyl-CoA thioesterase [Gammaproteobacteria bacterium RIFCSPLOWO2_02_FULL_47_50]|nr:MAG: acyl-CoA thioesterase [Gammaproteobacteria bacterium RIFCSPLOWO2_01_FULL_47_190]OGT73863.1 MAG: acyl-CoA thioesterase [Gammaproteobacteria bacterium RIFCSPLOWO2_12_47_11]OGT80969.1 MAG: acyl-CoA thioesterase [Gammaproteobacteria bacterium RIFCSPLOWO2_02_FULL_47_50]OGT84869.1 MAG: acyl-CoA thioesterase [Gammaproteobacteria bacterium RIFCSPLOWO2_12_FULL_47_76]